MLRAYRAGFKFQRIDKLIVGFRWGGVSASRIHFESVKIIAKYNDKYVLIKLITVLKNIITIIIGRIILAMFGKSLYDRLLLEFKQTKSKFL